MSETIGLQETQAPAKEETAKLSLTSIANPGDREIAMLFRQPANPAGMMPLEVEPEAAQDPIQSYVDRLSPVIAEQLDRKVLPGEAAASRRIEEINGLLNRARSDISRMARGDQRRAQNNYDALLRSVADKDSKFEEGSFDLVLGIDPKTNAITDTVILSGPLNRHAKSIAEKLDSGRESQVELAKVEFFKSLEGEDRSVKVPFMRAIDGHEKGAIGRDKHAVSTHDQSGKFQRVDIKWTHKPTQEEITRTREEAIKENLQIPKPGELIRFEDLISKYKTSIGDAYKKSKALAKGQPGKSETLESVVDGILQGKDLHDVKVAFIPQDRDVFDPQNNILYLDINKTPAKQIESFVHEGTHAAFQDIKRLYLSGDLTREQFLDLKVGPNGDEARAYEAQIKVFDELTHSMGTSGVYGGYVNDRGEQIEVNLADIYHNEGRAGFVRHLMDVAKSNFVIGGQPRPATYREYFDSLYDNYFTPNAAYFTRQKDKYSALYNNGGEAVRKLVDKGF